MKVYVIIVTYNGMRWIERCLNSLRQSTVPVVPVVIDNASTDGTPDFVSVHFPEAVVAPQKRNLGFGQANNVGLRWAMSTGAEWFMLLNQDAYLQPNALELLLPHADGAALLSPLHLNGDGSALDAMFRLGTMVNTCRRDAEDAMAGKNVHPLIDALLLGNRSGCFAATEICAACWLMPRALLKQVGGFNPLFFQYSEDNNYYHRLVYHHIPVLLVPEAHVWHDRVVHGNPQAFDSNRLYRELLLSACDINHGVCRTLLLWFRRLLKCYRHELPQRRYRPGAFLVAAWKVMRQWRDIKYSRYIELEDSMPWL